MNPASAPFAYDEVEYPSLVHPQMHPSRLAAIARLHGVAAASPHACRLLEVGCGDGLQLITLALAYPASRFVGVDLSTKAIARGEAMRAALHLDNLRLVAADLMQWDAGTEPYDYVLAHGFYSWVPEPVRERLLQLCNANLGPNGVAYISYNTLPGCHLRRLLWDILRFHAGSGADAAENVRRACECLDLLLLGMPDDTPYRTTLAGEIRDLKARLDPRVLFHDDLAQINDPCTLDQFMRAASDHALRFVAEASYHEMSLHNAHPDARPMLEEIARDDLVTKEQYLDFFTGRRFRQTLLCRAGANPRTQPDPSTVADLALVTELLPDPQHPSGQAAMRFTRASSGSLETDDAIVQSILARCGRVHPQALPVATLLQSAGTARSDATITTQDRKFACAFLLRAFQAGLVEFHVDAPAFARHAPSHPIASPLARRQLEAGQTRVISLRPSTVQLEDPLTCGLMLGLDGTRDRAAILAFLRQQLAQDGTIVEDELEAGLDGALDRIGALGLLYEADDDLR